MDNEISQAVLGGRGGVSSARLDARDMFGTGGGNTEGACKQGSWASVRIHSSACFAEPVDAKDQGENIAEVDDGIPAFASGMLGASCVGQGIFRIEQRQRDG